MSWPRAVSFPALRHGGVGLDRVADATDRTSTGTRAPSRVAPNGGAGRARAPYEKR